MKSIIISIFVCIFIVASAFQTLGEEWTAEQKELWDFVVSDYELFKKGDVNKVMESRHSDLVIYWHTEPDPYNRESARKLYEGWFKFDTPVNWELKPKSIKVIGNIAIVNFEWKYSGDTFADNGRMMRIFIKHHNKWQVLSEMTASCDKLPECN